MTPFNAPVRVNLSEYGYDIWFEKTVMNGLVSGRKSLVVSGINHRYSHHRLTTFTLLLVQGTRRPTPDRSHLMAPQYEHNVVSPRKRCLFDDDDDERISTTRAAQYSTRHWGGLAGTRGYSCRHYSPASQHNCPVETPIDNRPPARPPATPSGPPASPRQTGRQMRSRCPLLGCLGAGGSGLLVGP